jgi:hypothetical protein
MTTQTHRRARHSLSLLHAHLVFVTTGGGIHRRDAHLVRTHHARRVRRSRRRAGQRSTVKPTTCTYSSPTHPNSRSAHSSSDSKAVPLTRYDANTPAPVYSPTCADTAGHRPISPSPAAHRCRSSSHPRTIPTPTNAGLQPTMDGIGSPRTEVRGLRPRIRSFLTARKGRASQCPFPDIPTTSPSSGFPPS